MPDTFNLFFAATRSSPLEPFHGQLHEALEQFYEQKSHGRTSEWDELLAAMPRLAESDAQMQDNTVSVTSNESVDIKKFTEQLEALKPWRKGPFNLLGVKIDTEWRSDWKWQRLLPHIASLDGRVVLDVGTGNGYFLYRMLGSGAKLALGVDPTRLFLYQFLALQQLMPKNNAHLLPLRGEHLPPFGSFDTVFSLGVLYHRRSPLEHLAQLLGFLRKGGELVLETLVVPGDEQTILVPRDRYAAMANVWFLPAQAALETLLTRAGFDNVRCVDINQTSLDEQRATDWMTFQSLRDFLDPEDRNKTIEGYPAPRRAIMLANKP